ncbi:MAG: hypothetical protein JXR96_05525 [Deltaproteobacteria bacterium]|nr:hypothetical protein [Deltaproteobacteria bacterium]
MSPIILLASLLAAQPGPAGSFSMLLMQHWGTELLAAQPGPAERGTARSPGSGGAAVRVARKAAKRYSMSFDRASVAEVARWFAKRGGRNFIVPDALREKRLTIICGSPVDEEQAFRGLVLALEAEGLQLVESGSFWKVARRGESGSARIELLAGIQQTGETSWRIEREELDRTLANLNSIATQARIVPSFSNGVANGFKLFAIRPDSFYSRLGLQNGDVIHKINGCEINSPDKALEVYQKLRTTETVTVELTRRGRPVTHIYRIADHQE